MFVVELVPVDDLVIFSSYSLSLSSSSVILTVIVFLPYDNDTLSSNHHYHLLCYH